MAREYVVTQEDVQIRFLGDGSEPWGDANVLSISYSTGPVGAHRSPVRVGQQRWEGLLQADDESLGKALMVISVAKLPDPSKRTMEFRFRVRITSDDGASQPFVTGWSGPNAVKIIGKPGRANRTG